MGSTRSHMPFYEKKIFLSALVKFPSKGLRRFYVYIVMRSDLALFASWTDTLLFINTRRKSLWGKVRHFLECTNPSDSLWSYNKQIIDQICFPFLSWYNFLEFRFKRPCPTCSTGNCTKGLGYIFMYILGGNFSWIIQRDKLGRIFFGTSLVATKVPSEWRPRWFFSILAVSTTCRGVLAEKKSIP